VAYTNGNGPLTRTSRSTTPEWLLDEGILSRISASGVAGKIEGLQASALRTLMSSSRLNRLAEQKAMDAKAYGLMDLMNQTRAGVFTAANTNSTFGRTLQANYVDGLASLLGSDQVSNDVKAAARATLTSLRSSTNSADKGIVGGHQMELAHKIDVALKGIESIMKGK